LSSKINPQFQKILLFFRIPKADSPGVPQATACFAPVCQVQIFAQKICHSKKHHLPKSGEIRDTPLLILCEPKLNIHRIPRLWKTLVEKSVENVENYELSTDIPLLSKSGESCGIPAYAFA
jgi:hypothetical protein